MLVDPLQRAALHTVSMLRPFTIVTSAALAAIVCLSACVLGPSSQERAEYQANVDQQLRHRAAFDFGCTPEQVTLTYLGDMQSRGAEGCGRRATYLRVRDQWVMNSEASESQRDMTTR